MSWEEFFEARYFNGRIIKSTIDNPLDRFIKAYPESRKIPSCSCLKVKAPKEDLQLRTGSLELLIN